MNKQTIPLLVMGLLFLWGSPFFVLAQDYEAKAKFTVPLVIDSIFHTVVRATDGDTLKLANGERVRLIGIDTPESSNNPKTRKDSQRTGQQIDEIITMGKQAAAFTKQLVEGKNVRLEFDVQQRDRYGRLLAYVFLEDGRFVNAEIIKAGYAQVMTIPPNVKYQDLFLKLHREAREERRGLWK